MLGMNERNYIVEIFFGSCGLFIGSVFPALQSISKIWSTSSDFGFTDLFGVVICAVSLGAALLACFVWRRSAKDVQKLTEIIRSRKETFLEHGA